MSYLPPQSRDLVTDLTTQGSQISAEDLAQVKEQFLPAQNVEISDTALTSALRQALDYIASKVGMALLPCSCSVKILPRQYGRELILPRRPLLRITSVVCYDETGTATGNCAPDRIVFSTVRATLAINSSSAPSSRVAEASYLTVNFVAGYAGFHQIPADLRRILLSITRHFYLLQGEAGLTTQPSAPLPKHLDTDLTRYRNVRI